jgi:hypothetical protein
MTALIPHASLIRWRFLVEKTWLLGAAADLLVSSDTTSRPGY